MTPPANTPHTLVIGGTGTTGSRVVERLKAKGVPVRSVSRSSDPSFSWDDPETWAAAFEGADRAYIVHPVLMTPEAAEQIGNLARAAAAAGLAHLVLLSAYGVDEQVADVEAAVKASGAQWTIVRPSWFNQNFETETLPLFRAGILSGRFETAIGNAVHGFIDAGDIADVVVAALTEPGHEGKSYDLTGPQLMSFSEAVAEISAALGRDIAYIDLSPEQLRALLIEQGVPEDVVDWQIIQDPSMEDAVGTGVQDALGREPKDFATYAREAAATGVWSPA